MAEQRSLDFEAVARAERAAEQTAHLERVSLALGPKIVTWAACRLAAGLEEFRASELHEAVGGAPASADRVLRDLRRRGVVGCKLIDRASSLYVLEWVRASRLGKPRRRSKRERLIDERARHLERLAEIEAALAAEGEAA